MKARRLILLPLLLSSLSRAETPADPAKNPLADQPGAISEGQKLFRAGCGSCHGVNGEGGRGPDLVRAWFVRRASDRHVFDVIRNGVPGSEMPPSRMPEQNLWQIVAFLRSVSAPAYDMPVTGGVEAGRNIFFGKGGCAGCHSIAGHGGAIGPDLSDAGKANPLMKLRESVLDPNAFVAEGYKTVKVITADGREIAGVAKDNTNYSIVVLDARGELHLLMKNDLRTVTFSQKSLMPADYETRLTAAELEDLLAFLSRQAGRPAGRGKE
jgi:putative heme-binding domain-containing protein